MAGPRRYTASHDTTRDDPSPVWYLLAGGALCCRVVSHDHWQIVFAIITGLAVNEWLRRVAVGLAQARPLVSSPLVCPSDPGRGTRRAYP